MLSATRRPRPASSRPILGEGDVVGGLPLLPPYTQSSRSDSRGAVTGAARFVTDNVGIVANEALLMATETVEAVTRRVRTAGGTIETVARASLVYAVRGWRSRRA